MNLALYKTKRFPILPEDAGTVAHVYFDGNQLRDTRGNVWSLNGTIAQAQRSGKTPPGAGPFTSANYYSLGSGSDVMDFAGDFTVTVIFNRTSEAAGSNGPVSNGSSLVGGWWFDIGFSPAFVFVTATAGSNVLIQSANNHVAGVNVMSGGRVGTNQIIKGNLGVMASGAAAAITPGTANAAMIGRLGGGTAIPFLPGTVLEVLVSSLTPVDAQLTAMQQRVKTKLGITSW